MDDMFFILTSGGAPATDPQPLSVSTTTSGTHAGACLLSTSLTVYFDDLQQGFIGDDLILYTTSALTTRYNGGNTFHKIGGAAGSISTVGVISSFNLCF